MKNTFTSLPLTAGQFARIVVEQPAVDVVLTLLKPDGQPSAEVNNYPQHEPEHLSLVAETSGDYQLKISAADPRAARASYKNQSRRLARVHASRFAIRGRRKEVFRGDAIVAARKV